MKNKYIISVLLLALIPFLPVNSQEGSSGSRDKYTLLTMPYNKRPLYLYKGQFQLNTGYKFAVRGRSYDSGGEMIKLKDNGTGSVMHYYSFELKYGITDFLEMTLQTDYMKKGVRSETVQYWSGTDYRITVNDLAETRGMGDLLLQAAARLPMEYKWYDVGLACGIYLPIAKSETPQPSHTITDATGANIYTINYHYNYVNGNGVPVYLLSAAAKLTLSKFTFSTDYTIKTPSKEGENIRWDQAMQTTKSFTYTNKPYLYLLNTTKLLNISAHFQAAGWLDINLNASVFKSAGGWTEYMGGKYKNPEQSIVAIEPGLELQISPAITIYQRMSLPLSGKNADAPFYLFATVSVNMFPFMK
jgi:hypothetical protein